MTPTDAYDLRRFVDAQQPVFSRVRLELAEGRKRSHWMWFIFPQIAGLGHSEMARRFAISSRAEAAAYLAHPILGPRLEGCTRLITTLVVSYPPSGKTPPHRHGSAFVVGYVISGSIRSQINGGEIRIFHAGESWTENPHAHHTTSENASDTEPAKLLAIFIADAKDDDLVTFDSK